MAETHTFSAVGAIVASPTVGGAPSPARGRTPRPLGGTMTFSKFYRGFLYALRERLGDDPKFIAEGDEFHQAFREALEFARERYPEVPADQMLRNFDPVFGVSPEATEMVLEGERDFIVSLLNPRLRIAQFKIDVDSATQRLNRMPEEQQQALREVAERFHKSLHA